MTQDEKELLLKDLSARVPYNVKAYVRSWSWLINESIEDNCVVHDVSPYLNTVSVYSELESVNVSVNVILGNDDYDIKPYLFPMTSMTDEQKSYLYYNTKFDVDRYGDLITKFDEDDNYLYTDLYDYLSIIDWLNKNHFDYRGLIEKGLAIDCTNMEIY